MDIKAMSHEKTNPNVNNIARKIDLNPRPNSSH